MLLAIKTVHTTFRLAQRCAHCDHLGGEKNSCFRGACPILKFHVKKRHPTSSQNATPSGGSRSLPATNPSPIVTQ